MSFEVTQIECSDDLARVHLRSSNGTEIDAQVKRCGDAWQSVASTTYYPRHVAHPRQCVENQIAYDTNRSMLARWLTFRVENELEFHEDADV